MDDQRLRQLLDQPPRDPEPAPDPAFTASVMERVAPATSPLARSQRTAFSWLAGGVVAALALLAPADAVGGIDELARSLDLDLVAELGVVSLAAAVALALASAGRRMPA